MCDPLTISAITTTLAVGQQVAQYQGAKAQAAGARQAANLNYAQQWNVTEARREQLDSEASEKSLDTAIAALQSEGRIAASASESGYSSGAIIEAINADMFGLGRNAEIDAVNDRNARNQLANERMGAAITRSSALANNKGPSSLSLVLGLGQAVAGGVKDYRAMGGR